MKIDRLDLLAVEIPLRFPFETSFGRWTTREAILIRVQGGGLEGWGEVTAHEAPFYSYETLSTARDVIIHHLGPAILREPVTEPDALAGRLAFVRGHPMAKAGVEGAVRDLLARRDRVSLSSQIQGTRRVVDAGVSLGVEPSPEDLVERARPFVEAGYHRVKAKIRPGWDLEPLTALRRAFPTQPLAADANAAYQLDDADHLARLDDLGLALLEQPLAWDDVLDHAALARRVRTPLCLDESITGLAAARVALELGSAHVINVKLGRVGGMSVAMAIHDLSRIRGVPVWCGGMLETCIGRLHNLALASLPGFVLPGDLSGSDRYFEVDLVDPPIRVEEGGHLAVPDGPGIGRTVDRDAVARCTVAETTVSAP